MTQPLVLYREYSNDSMCAAWIYSRYVEPYSEFVPVQRDDPAPNMQGRDVVLLDFSYEHGALKMLNQQAHSLLVIAHHEEDGYNLSGLHAHFDSTKSAARLTWEQLVDPILNPDHPAHYPTSRPRVEPPWLIDYIEDRELHRHKLPSYAVEAALASYPREFHIWDEIAGRGPEELSAEGEILLRRQALHIEAALDSELVGYVTIKPDDHRVPCVCVNGGVLVAEIAEALVGISAYNIGVCFYHKPDGTVHYHLRAFNRDIDCKRIADHYKGESTPFTADFTLDKPLPFTGW